MLFWIVTAVLVVAYWVGSLLRARRNVHVVPQLDKLPLPEEGEELPRVSVVVPARNEAASIERCLRTLLSQDYPDLEILAVNDRSTDGTGDVMDRVAAEFPLPPEEQESASVSPRLRVVHITELPHGWLGKCNALSQGAAQATGDVLLFTDGDVLFDPTVLRRSVAYLRKQEADMMVVMPEVLTSSFLEQVMILVFGHSLLTAFPPASAMDRKSNAFIGVGAFNMIRARTYKRIHGHRFLRLQVVDDAGLGKLVKHSGGIICAAFGRGMVRVRWQESVLGVVRGLEKNSFAAMRYSVARTLIGSLGLLFIYWWPWVGMFTGPVSARVMCGFGVLAQLAVGAGARRYAGLNAAAGLFLPIGALLLAYTLLRSMVVTLRQGGIRWRDSFYPLQDLRQFKL